MRFSKDWEKLQQTYFTTVRKNTGIYQLGKTYTIQTPTQRFKAKVVVLEEIEKEGLTDGIAKEDIGGTRKELIKLLENWYGKKFNNFVLLGLKRCPHKNTVALNEEGNAGVYCSDCGEKVSDEV